jgi:hypothetical protein
MKKVLIPFTVAVMILTGQSAMAVRNDENTTPTATPLPRFTLPPVKSPSPRPTVTEVIIGPGGIVVTPQTGPSASPSTGTLDPTKGKLVSDRPPVAVKPVVITGDGKFRPGPLFTGTLLCPILAPDPLRVTKGCISPFETNAKLKSKANGPATFLGASKSDDCASYGRVAGLGAPFKDPRNGGECWACPVLTHRTVHPVDSKDSAKPACTSGNDDGILWQSAQYPEPGVAVFLDPLVVQLAFSNAAYVDAFLAKRGGNKADLWNKMTNAPNDSAEFKALVFAALLVAAEKSPSYTARPGNAVSIFQDYIRKRRTYVAQDAVGMYNAYLDFNAYKQWKAAGAAALGGGPAIFQGFAKAVIQPPSGGVGATVGVPPDDYVNAAYAAAVPDKRGDDFMKALVDLGGTSYQASSEESGVDPTAAIQLGITVASSAVAMHDVLDGNEVIKAISVLSGKGGFGVGLGMGLVGTVLDGVAAALTLYAQLEADKQYSKLIDTADQPVSISKILKSGTDEDKNSLVMWWALATSPYKASAAAGDGSLTDADVCANYRTQCNDVQQIVAKARATLTKVK